MTLCSKRTYINIIPRDSDTVWTGTYNEYLIDLLKPYILPETTYHLRWNNAPEKVTQINSTLFDNER